MMNEVRDDQLSAPPPEAFVDLEALEAQLAKVWRPESVQSPDRAGLSTHTSVLNLVILAEGAEAREQAKRVTEHLASVLSCRVIIFNIVDGSTQRTPTVDVYAACRLSENHPHGPCIERVQVPVRRSMMREIPSVTRSLIIPGLPTFVWWVGTPSFSDQPVIDVLRGGNRFIVDSHTFSSTSDLKSFQRSRDLMPEHVACADLNWERLRPWRQLTAQFFDFRHVQWALSCVREVEIEAGPTPGNGLPAQALMFACWMGHCLDWKPFEARRTRKDRWYIGVRDRDGQHVRIMIRTRPVDEANAGHLLSLSIAARDESGKSSTLSLSRRHGSPVIRMHAKSGIETTLHHTVHQPLLPEEVLLAHLLESPDHDLVFEDTLRHAGSVVDLLERR